MDKNNLISEMAFEDLIEIELNLLGWISLDPNKINRKDNRETINFDLVLEQIKIINDVNEQIANKAIMEIKKISDNIIEMNIQGQKLLTDGIKVFDDEQDRYISVKLISKNSDKNIYHVVRQMEISNGKENRLPDVLLYVNGLPLVVMELKSPLAMEKIEDAFKQNESLKRHNPKLWTFNIINFLSNNVITKYGSMTSSFKFFYGWNKWNLKENLNPISYLFNKKMIYKIIHLYTFYTNEQTPVKYLAAPHQIKAVESTINKLDKKGDPRGGVIWHTQGSGKSVTMVFLAKAITQTFSQPTILMVTDRTSLDKQLYKRFLDAESYLRNKADMVTSRKDLIEKLNDKKHFGIFFTTVQKFVEETGLLSARDDIFILVDEAHRTQNNLDGDQVLSKEKKEMIVKFGYARFMRDAFPNAKITGFTGTPLMKFDNDTRKIFGEYNDIYSMNDAVKDGATVPIHYELRKPKINLDNEQLKIMDQLQNDYVKTLNPNDLKSQQKIDELLKSVKLALILEDEEVIKAKVIDIVEHLEKRKNILHGKAMIVANSRIAAFKYYKNIVELYPEIKDQVILVMTGSNKDKEEMYEAIVNKSEIDNVASEFRKPNSKYKIAIVVDMWLTGFDVPDLDVMYIDKIIKWHNLMQAIARVNRTYEDKETKQVKETGLVVDYIGIWKYLSEALIQYASGANDSMDINMEDVHKAKEKLDESFDILESNYIPGIMKFDLLDAKEKYNFIVKSMNNLLNLSVEEQNKFIKLARKIKRFFKITFSILSEKDSIICKGIEIINSWMTVSSIQGDETLTLTIEAIKKAVQDSIDASKTEVEIMESKISKDINMVSSILAEEAETLVKTAPRVAIELLKNSIESQISEIKKIRPVFAKKASDKLVDIINEMKKTEDVEKVIEMLKALGDDVKSESSKKPDFIDPQLQAFFEVISNDEYLTHNANSEVLRRIAQELMDVVKENITDQFHNNPKVRSKVLIELKKLLKQKYNYPPKQLGDMSGILINQISKEIKINESFFRKDD